MAKILMICAVIGLAAAYPAGPSADDVHSEIIRSSQDVRADGFDVSWETSNHITRSESGDEHGNINGQFGWISPDGEHIEFTYVADEHGYQPKSDWLPTPPSIPEYIQRAIPYNQAYPGTVK